MFKYSIYSWRYCSGRIRRYGLVGGMRRKKMGERRKLP